MNKRVHWLWACVLALYALSGYALVPFHADESTQIFMSHDFHYHFLQNDLERLYYNPNSTSEDEQYLRLINGTVNKYSMGLAWWLAGYTVEDVNQDWVWGESFQYNVEAGNTPSPGLLRTARLPSSLFLAGSVLLLFWAAMRFAGRPVAYIATTYYALNPAVLLNGRRAMMEGSLMFGLAAVLLVGVLFVQARGWRIWAIVGLLALASGFAVAGKHTNAFVVASVFVGCALHAGFQRETWQQALRRLGALAVAGVLAIGVFFALNPGWWATPVAAANYALEERSTLLSAQAGGNAGYTSPRHQLQGFYRQVLVGTPMHYEVGIFGEALAADIDRYNASGLGGLRPTFAASVIIFFLFVLGLFPLFGALPMQSIDADARWVVGSYIALMTLFVIFVTPLEWQRYYLVGIPAVGLSAALGAAWIGEQVVYAVRQSEQGRLASETD